MLGITNIGQDKHPLLKAIHLKARLRIRIYLFIYNRFIKNENLKKRVQEKSTQTDRQYGTSTIANLCN